MNCSVFWRKPLPQVKANLGLHSEVPLIKFATLSSRSAIHRLQLAPRGLLLFNKVTVKKESVPVTLVLGPRSLELGSGKVAGKVLIVDHM